MTDHRTNAYYMALLVLKVCRVHRDERLKAQADERRKLWEATKT